MWKPYLTCLIFRILSKWSRKQLNTIMTLHSNRIIYSPNMSIFICLSGNMIFEVTAAQAINWSRMVEASLDLALPEWFFFFSLLLPLAIRKQLNWMRWHVRNQQGEVSSANRLFLYSSDIVCYYYVHRRDRVREKKEIGYWKWTMKPEEQGKTPHLYSHKQTNKRV